MFLLVPRGCHGNPSLAVYFYDVRGKIATPLIYHDALSEMQVGREVEPY